MEDDHEDPADLIETYRERLLLGEYTAAEDATRPLREMDCPVCGLMGRELGSIAVAASCSLDDDAAEELADLGVRRADSLLKDISEADLGVEHGA